MKLYKLDELPSETGDILLFYGESGVGKSVSTLQTAPDPILYFLTEPRDPRKFLQASGRTDVKIKFGFYESWDDTMEFFTNPENTAWAKTIVVDSLTFLSNIQLTSEIEDQSWDSRTEKEKLEKSLINRTKMSLEGFGGLAGQMTRFVNIISKLSQSGKTIILLSLLEQNPKFNRELSAGPALKGKDFPKSLPGFCDFIGLVEPRLRDGETIFPPKVTFQSDGSFLAKWTGCKGPAAGPMDITRILDTAHGRVPKTKGGDA
jgi:hypothetical protein